MIFHHPAASKTCNRAIGVLGKARVVRHHANRRAAGMEFL